jgi:two-component system cell cycle response regulator
MIGKILIVDDVSSNRIVFKVKLTAAGYQTLTTADGEVALRLALVERPPDQTSSSATSSLRR